MIGYRFALTCPGCGEPLEHREGTETNPGPDRGSVEAWCEPCMTRWRVEVAIVPVEVTHLPGSTASARQRAADSCSVDLLGVFS